MAVEADIIDLLLADGDVSGVIGTKVYALRAPQSAAVPFLIVRTVSRTRFPHSGGASGLVSSRIQIDSYGESYGEVKPLADLVRDTLDGLSGTVGGSWLNACLLESEQDIDEPPVHGEGVGDARVSQDYMVKHREVVPTLED